MAYFSNSSEGEMLDEQCANCPLGEKACPVYAVQGIFNYKKEAWEFLDVLIPNSTKICGMKVLIDGINPSELAIRKELKHGQILIGGES